MMFDRFTRDDKMLLGFAMAEAADLGHSQLGTDHLILGMLCNARSPLFAILTDQGLNLVTAREAVTAFHDEHDTDDAAAAERSAADRYDEDREALRSIGIDLDKVRAAVADRFGDDLADGWAQRPERDRGRGRGHRGDCGPHGRGHARGHRGHRGRRGPGPDGWGPQAAWGPQGWAQQEWAQQGWGPQAAEHDGPPRPPFGPGFGPGPFGPGGPNPFDGPFEPGRGRRGPRGRGMRPRFAPETRAALETAVGIARDRGDRRLRAEYLLLGILENADPASQAVLSGAASVDDLKAAVLASLPEAPAGV